MLGGDEPIDNGEAGIDVGEGTCDGTLTTEGELWPLGSITIEPGGA